MKTKLPTHGPDNYCIFCFRGEEGEWVGCTLEADTLTRDARAQTVKTLTQYLGFTSVLTPEALHLVNTPVDVEGGEEHSSVVYLGVSVEGAPDARHLKAFARLVNKLVESSAIEVGAICPAMYMALSPTCDECGELFATLGPKTVEEKHADCIAKHAGARPPLTVRGAFLFYPRSSYTRDQLNEKFCEGLFVEEGALPSVSIEEVSQL